MSQEELLTTLSGQGNSLLEVSGLQGLLLTIVPLLIALGVVLGLLSLIMLISRLRSQKAMVSMQQDIKIIREIIERQYANSQSPAVKNDPQLPPKP